MTDRKTYAGIFFDLDDTLIEGCMSPPQRYGRVVPLPGRVELLAELIRAGIKLGIASNQAGVGLGYITPDQANQKRSDALADLDLWGRGVPLLMAYWHEDSQLANNGPWRPDWRKPNPGMLLELAEHFKLSPDDCLFVGDRPEDRQAAENAGMAFCHAESFFADGYGLTLARLNNHARAEAAALAENRRGLLDDQPSRGYTPPRQYGPAGQALGDTRRHAQIRYTANGVFTETGPDEWADVTTHGYDPRKLGYLDDDPRPGMARSRTYDERRNPYRAHRIDSSENGPLGSPAPPRLPLAPDPDLGLAEIDD